jgi:outer membrane protein TolC
MRYREIRQPRLALFSRTVILIFWPWISQAAGQTGQPPALLPSSQAQPSPAGAPITITFQDALERARRNEVQALSAETDARIAREERIQARAALLPSVSFTSQYLGTQGNGKLPSGRYVTNDGVHVYRIWGVFHQVLPTNTLQLAPYKRAIAAEAQARAKAEIARRGLVVTVTKNYYDLVVSQRKYATAQQSLEQARQFLQISQERERGGEVAHSDVIKAQLQFNQAQRGFQDTQLSMENARLNLAVLLFSTFDENFTVVDDLDRTGPLPGFDEIQSMAARENPDLRAAMAALRQADLDVSAALAAYLPSLGVDVDYGIEANAVALRSRVSAAREAGRLPNVGYFATFTFNWPIWDWGTIRSKVRQSRYREQLARVQLSLTQRQLLGSLRSFYNEASVSRTELETLRQSAELAADSVRLTTLRYQAGEATVLEVVDAQNTLGQARNAYDDGQARYRLALSNLQTLTGSF